MIEIVEIIRRSEQGVTQPFICRADDGHVYFVKGAGAGQRALVAEWVAGRLGRALGLPIPEFSLAEVPGQLVRHSPRSDIRDLGAGSVFASREVSFATELRWADVAAVPPGAQSDLLLFDCWVANGDRTLSALGGNVNLLWTPSEQRLHVIDHNVAFDADSPASIREHHVFSTAASQWTEDFRIEAERRLSRVLEDLWPKIWEELPEEWTDNLHGLDKATVREILWRFAENPAQFWPTP